MKILSKGQRTRERIILASLQAFAESGCDGASLRRIAQQVQLTEPALYRHFTDKQQLYRSALRHTATTLEDGLVASVSGAVTPADLLVLGDDLLALMSENPSLPAMTQQLLATGTDELSTGLFGAWSSRCRELGLEGGAIGSLILLNLLSQSSGFVRARRALLTFWGEAQYSQLIEPEQRQQLRRLLRGWMLR